MVTDVRYTIVIVGERVRRTVSVAERRGWDRLPISIPFFVRGTNAAGEEFLEFATALNLSAGRSSSGHATLSGSRNPDLA